MAGNFSWAAAADLGLSALTGLFSGSASRSIARSQNRIAEAENMVRVARNEATVSRNSLLATVKGLNNKRVMEQAGKNFNIAANNLQRMAEGFAQGNFEAVIRGAEAMGSLAASGVTSGAMPGATAGAEYSAALQQGRYMAQSARSQERALYDGKMQAAGIVSNAYMSLDRNYDYGFMDQYRAVGAASASGGGWLDDVLSGILGNTSSLQTLLGSIGGGQGVQVNPVSRGDVVGTNLGTLSATTPTGGAQAYPVNTSWVTGTPLQSLPAIKFQSQVKGM